MSRRILFSIVVLFLGFNSNLKAEDSVKDSSFRPNDFIEEETSDIDDKIDSLVNNWFGQNGYTLDSTVSDFDVENDSVLSNVPDSVYKERLARIPTLVPLTYNRTVRNYIEMYLYKRRDIVEVMAGKANYFFPIFDEIYDKYQRDVPNEIKYMSIIESALNQHANSRTRAIGLWQFMYGTGRLYGLTINSLVDERKDPIKATEAAIRFSRDLFNMFQDWQLVVAAYNCGPGNVKKAIRRSGGKRNFWDIYYYLPRETRGHVPAFIASIYVMNYYREHGIVAKPVDLPLATDTIMIYQDLHLGQVSEILNVQLDLLRELNPQYIHDIIPARGGVGYSLRLPVDYISKYIDQEKVIMAYKDTVFFNNILAFKNPSTSKYDYVPSKNHKKIRYVVKNGDCLGSVSMKFGVSISDIKMWNNIRRNTIFIGQKLDLYVPKSKAKNYADNNTDKTKTKEDSSIDKNDQQYTYYTVRQGDTVWDIIKKYPGVTLAELKKDNNIDDDGKILTGQKIKIIVKN